MKVAAWRFDRCAAEATVSALSRSLTRRGAQLAHHSIDIWDLRREALANMLALRTGGVRDRRFEQQARRLDSPVLLAECAVATSAELAFRGDARGSVLAIRSAVDHYRRAEVCDIGYDPEPLFRNARYLLADRADEQSIDPPALDALPWALLEPKHTAQRSSEDPTELGVYIWYALNIAGVMTDDIGNSRCSLKLAEAALDVASGLQRSDRLAVSAYNIASLHGTFGHLAATTFYLEVALRQDPNNWERLIDYRSLLAAKHEEFGSREMAADLVQDAADLVAQKPDMWVRDTAIANLILVAERLSLDDVAEGLMDNYRALRASSNPDAVGALTGLRAGLRSYARGDTDTARVHVDAVLPLATQVVPTIGGEIELLDARLCLRQGDPEAAIARAQAMLPVGCTFGLEARVYELLAEAYGATGDWAAALATQRLLVRRVQATQLDPEVFVRLELGDPATSRQSYSELSDAAARLSHVLDCRDRFRQLFCHEVRHPLSILRIQADLSTTAATIGEASACDDQSAPHPTDRRRVVIDQKALDRLRLAAARLETTVQTMSDSGSSRAHAVRFDPGELLRDLVSLWQQRAEHKGVTIRVEHVPSVIVVGFLDDVAQAVTNLLSNAVKFTRSGDVIEVGVSFDDDSYSITVSDSGPGIDVDLRSRIFRWGETGTADPQDESSSGLGLYMTAVVVESIGGTIVADASPLGGAHFAITMPRNTGGKHHQPRGHDLVAPSAPSADRHHIPAHGVMDEATEEIIRRTLEVYNTTTLPSRRARSQAELAYAMYQYGMDPAVRRLNAMALPHLPADDDFAFWTTFLTSREQAIDPAVLATSLRYFSEAQRGLISAAESLRVGEPAGVHALVESAVTSEDEEVALAATALQCQAWLAEDRPKDVIDAAGAFVDDVATQTRFPALSQEILDALTDAYERDGSIEHASATCATALALLRSRRAAVAELLGPMRDAIALQQQRLAHLALTEAQAATEAAEKETISVTVELTGRISELVDRLCRAQTSLVVGHDDLDTLRHLCDELSQSLMVETDHRLTL